MKRNINCLHKNYKRKSCKDVSRHNGMNNTTQNICNTIINIMKYNEDNKTL